MVFGAPGTAIPAQAYSPAGVHTVIVGLGTTGLSCARFLYRRGLRFAVTDSRSQPPGLARFRQECPDMPISVGCFDENMIQSADQVVLTPGVAWNERVLRTAAAGGAQVIGDIELFARLAQAPVVAITGANGKSTVTALLGEMARAARIDVRVGGNLGTPALDLLGDGEPEFYVLALSSFQLEIAKSLSPVAATVLNITPDHTDHYDGITSYAAAKQPVFRGHGTIVINADDPAVARIAVPGRRVLRFTLDEPGPKEFGVTTRDGIPWLRSDQDLLLPVSELKIKGAHNVANVLAAWALGTAINLERGAMLEALRTFSGLAHRCQWVAASDGVDWYNDSKATNEGATCAAIRGLADKRLLVLIAGGIAKGTDFTQLRRLARGRLRALVVLGKDGPRLARAMNGVAPVVVARDMHDAVVRARHLARPGDAVLLSPACASGDLFKDYVERGEAYVAAMRGLLRA